MPAGGGGASAFSNHFQGVVSTSNTPPSTDCLTFADRADHAGASYDLFALSGFLQSHPSSSIPRLFCNTLPHMINPSERVTMAELPSLTMEDLYAVLGFYKGHPTRSKDALHDELKHFYNNYIAAGNSHFPYTNTNTRSEPALQCARGFLLEDNRGERLWPITSGEVVEWHTDRE